MSISRGSADGLEVGHVLAINRYGRVIKDPEAIKENDKSFSSKLKSMFSFKKEKESKPTLEPGMVKLPDERIGLLMVFRVFERVSYALVMQASQPINKLDSVNTP